MLAPRRGLIKFELLAESLYDEDLQVRMTTSSGGVYLSGGGATSDPSALGEHCKDQRLAQHILIRIRYEHPPSAHEYLGPPLGTVGNVFGKPFEWDESRQWVARSGY